MRKEKERGLILAMDFGGSSTKCIGGTSFEKRFVIAMEPEVIEFPASLSRPRGEVGEADPKDRAWIELGGKYYAVGYLAQYRFAAHPQLSRLKVETAVYKVLAAVWVMAEKFKLGTQMKLALYCVLPPGESKNKEWLYSQLKEALREFVTQSGLMSVELVNFDCKAEGSGLFMLHRAKRGNEAIRSLVLAVVMLGYRNASVLACYRGSVGESVSADLGFVKLAAEVQQQTSGYQKESLATAIATAGDSNNEVPLKRLLRHRSTEQQQEELAQLRQAISDARQTYTIKLRDWLSEALPPQVEELVFCGGTSDYLKTELMAMFPQLSLYFHAQVELPADVRGLKMGHRFADIWCLWDCFSPHAFKIPKVS